MRTLYTTIILFVALASCKGKATIKHVIPQTDSTLTSHLTEPAVDENLIKGKERAKVVFDSLKKNFVAEEDDFNKITWYSHKTIGSKYWPNRKTLYSQVRSDGYFNLISNYYADDWIFHTLVKVSIEGKDIIVTPEVETFRENNRTDNSGGVVWENIIHPEPVAESILSQLSPDGKQAIKVRFEGRQFYRDVTLSAKDKKALIDAYLFANAIKTMNQQ